MIRKRLATIVICLLSAFVGYQLAQSSTRGNAGSDHQPPARHSNEPETTPSGSSAFTRHIRQRDAKQIAALKAELCNRFLYNPSPSADWALRDQTAAILATMSAEELRAFAAELETSADSSFSTQPAWKSALARQVMHQWSKKDPVSASLASRSAFDEWLKRDPEAATSWVTTGDFPPDQEKAGTQLQQNYLNHLAVTDLPSACASLGRLDLETQKEMLLSWSGLLAHDPAKRASLLVLVAARGDPELADGCYRNMVMEMAGKSPSDAAAFVETSNLSEDRKNQLSHQVIGAWAMKEPKQAFGAWLELGETEVPQPLLRAMDQWSLNFPGVDESMEWVNGLEAGPVREQFKSHMVGHLSNFERFQQAAVLGASLEDRKERIRQLQLVKRQWEEQYANQANEWYSKLPPEDRAEMEGTPR